MSSSLQDAVEALRKTVSFRPDVALVLGSGLGDLADAVQGALHVPYTRVPGMGTTSVSGHAGRFVAGTLEGRRVIAMQGRLHPYEGHSLESVVLGVRGMLSLGAGVLVVTNAAGGLDRALGPGTLVLIEDHINLSGRNCLVGPNDDTLGPRFPDMSRAYDPELAELARAEARKLGFELPSGVYAGVLGPSYETPAEVRMLASLGCHMVGMSTVQEVIAARHMGARVLGISCVTNLAAGLASELLRHEDVQASALRSAAQLTALVRGVIGALSEDVCRR
jgi:purine-nucleoside phosphorylase